MVSIESFGAKLGRLVLAKRGVEGLTQQQLAVLAFGDECKKARISELENGRVAKPHQKMVDALTVALNLSLEDLALCRGLSSLQISENLLLEFGVPRELATSLLMTIPSASRGEDPQSIRNSLAAKLEELRAILLRSASLHDEDKSWDEGLKIFDLAISVGRFRAAEEAIIELESRELSTRTVPQIQKQKRLRMMRADTALLGGDVQGARLFFSQAAQMFEGLSIDEAIACRREGNERLHWHGRKFDGSALNAAQTLIEDNLRILDRSSDPEMWADHCQLLALNLQFIGFRADKQQAEKMLKRAVRLHDQALSVFRKNEFFERWLICSTNRAVAFRFLATRLGEFAGSTALEAAVEAYEEIEANLPESSELELARTKVNLSSALAQKASYTNNPDLVQSILKRAITCGEYSLSIYEKHKMSRNQAIAHNNIGEAKVEMGRRRCSDNPVESIRAGIDHYLNFLTLQPREDDQVQWGEANENIGDAMLLLVETNGDANEHAIDHFQKALEAYLSTHSAYHYDKCKAKLETICFPKQS